MKIKFAIRAAITIAVVLLGVAITLAFGRRVKVSDSAMNPSLEMGQTLMIDTLSYKFLSPKADDIVVFAPNGSERVADFTRRILAVPGDTVRIYKGKLIINDYEVRDAFSETPIENPGTFEKEVKLGENQYFLMGDNRNNSEDSRFESIGLISKEEIIGKVWLRVWPFSFM